MPEAELTWTVNFRPGRYTYIRHDIKNPGSHPDLQKFTGRPYWEIGRVEDGVSVCFTYDENTAKWICLSLNMLDAHMRGDAEVKWHILRRADAMAKFTMEGHQTKGAKEIG